ncbi:MAG TPA: FG-GAP-like repeat-containing protein [Deferrisomatales bacterium]|nr:FG-GAP-like repeat-containing protein [Deferrisomatales bacterium]
MTHRLRAALLLLLTLALPPAAWSFPTVFVESVKLYNTPDLDSLAPGLRSMLASRLEGDGYEVRTEGDSPTGAGDWLVRTSITRLGSTYSLDAALISADGAAEGARSYETTDKPDDLVPALDKVAERLRQELARTAHRPLAAAPAPAAVPAAVPAMVSPPAAASAPVAPRVAAPAATTPANLQSALERQRTGPEIPGEGLSLAVADADADGNLEVLVLTGDSIIAFRDRGGELVQVWENPAPQQFTPTALSAGDMDGNGIPELFLAGTRDHSPTTQALEWFGSALVPKGERSYGFLRAVPHPAQGVLLLGMAAGTGKDLFGRGVRRFRWDGSGYREDGKYPVSERAVGANLDFLRLGDKQQVFTVITTQADRVQGFDADGTTVFEIDDQVKGTKRKLFGLEHTAGTQDEDIVQISGKTVGYHAPSGEDFVLVHKNGGGIGRLFARVASFSNGRILAYRWDGVGLSNAAQSPKYSGFFADIGLAPAAAGHGATLYAALVSDKAGFNKGQLTRVVAYDLP